MTANDKLREALNAAANYIDALGGDSRSYRQALAASKPELHFTEDAELMECLGGQIGASEPMQPVHKPEPQAQAGEPDNYKAWYEDAMYASNEAGYAGYDAAATIRAMRASIAKKDAALKECVEALMLARNKLCRVNDPIESHVADAAITQTEEAHG